MCDFASFLPHFTTSTNAVILFAFTPEVEKKEVNLIETES